MKVVDKPETFVLVNQYQYLSDILHQQRALLAQVADSVDKAEGTTPVHHQALITVSLLRISLTQGVVKMQQNGWKHIGRNTRDSRTETPREWSFHHAEQKSLDLQLVLTTKSNKACARKKKYIVLTRGSAVGGLDIYRLIFFKITIQEGLLHICLASVFCDCRH